MHTEPLDHRSPEPLYRQLAQRFESLIERGKLKDGEQIASESEIAEQFSVSRITVRRAIGDLVQRSLLLRRQGKGTFVRAAAIRHDLDTHGLLASLLAQHPSARADLVRFEIIPAPKAVAAAFAVRTGAPLCRVDRTYVVGKRAVAYGQAWVVPAIGELDRDFAARASTEAMLRAKGLEIDSSELSIRAEACSPSLARALSARVGDSMLSLRRLSYDRQHALLELLDAHFLPGAYEFFVTRRAEGLAATVAVRTVGARGACAVRRRKAPAT